MKNKKSKILKFIPGMTPNCSGYYGYFFYLFSVAGWFFLISVIAFINAHLIYRKFKKITLAEEKEKALKEMKISRSLKILSVIFLFLCLILWLSQLFLDYAPTVFLWFLLGQITATILLFLLSQFLGVKVLGSKRPKLIYAIMPLIILSPILLLIVWLVLGFLWSSILSLIFSAIDAYFLEKRFT